MFATNPIIQTELARATWPAATIAFALNSSMIYLGQGLGAVVGGFVTFSIGLEYLGYAGAGLGVIALLGVRALKHLATSEGQIQTA